VAVGKILMGVVLAAVVPVLAAAQAPQVRSGAAPIGQAPLPDPVVVVNGVRALIARDYVVPEMRKPLDAALARGLASGRYAHVDPMELANRLNADMAAVAHDKHLNIHFGPEEAQSLAAGPADAGDDDYFGRDGFWKKVASDNNQGVIKLEVLDGNVRYLNYRAFFWAGEPSKVAIDQAMAFLRGGDAIIIDLRDNGGGSPMAVRYLASYFIPEGTKLVTFYLKQNVPTISVAEAVPGGVISGRPVYVLTSGHTASAAEEFSSHVERFGFGKLVGETTVGGAYRNEMYPVAGAFVLSLSIGRPDLARGGGNWEGRGVAPAIATSMENALAAAQGDALTQLADKATTPQDKTELGWLAIGAKARATAPMPAESLTAYVVQLGERGVSVEGGQLVYRRLHGIQTVIRPIGPDLFVMDQDARTHLRYLRKDGTITGLQFEHPDGTSNIVTKG
jgi:hypothetical protein